MKLLRLHRAVAPLHKPKHNQHSKTSLSQTDSSILHLSPSTAISLTPPTNGDLQLKKDGLIIYSGRDIADLKDSLPDVKSQMSKAQAYLLMNTQNST